MWKKIIMALFLSITLTACHFDSQTAEKIPHLNPNNETGWTVLQGIYVKTELGHDVLVFEPESSEEMYIFMTFTEECDVPYNLQTGEKIAIKTVIVQENSGVDTTQVFEWEKYGDYPVPIAPDVLIKIEDLSQKLANADTIEK